MPDKEIPPLLIQTKLNQPSLPADMVHRPRLTKWLKQYQRRPLTLVSAPAGYGKSTLISCWVSPNDWPAAWVSLDEHDNELGNFLGYFLAAIQTIFPQALRETQTFLTVTTQPSVAAIAQTLIHELHSIEEPFILVLDDYHLIESQAVHGLLSELLSYPAHSLHLVLSTRMDPPLPLITLRAKNQMTEIRSQDLRFTQEETQKLFQEMLGASIDPADAGVMNAQAEGWITGLRLAALTLRHRIGTNDIQGEISARNRYVSEYLFSEILERQTVVLSNYLLKTSILNRFCAELCEVVCFSEKQLAADGLSETDFSGVHFLEWLQTSNLFVIPLDDRHEWFRYHHLFQDFLQQQLIQRFTPEELAEFHAIAGRWYAQKGWIEEALHHFLLIDDTTDAIALIAQHRYQLMNKARWPVLDHWSKRFPEAVTQQSPELCMLKIWLAYQQGRWNEFPRLAQQLEGIIERHATAEESARLAGERHAVHSVILFLSGEIEKAVSQARLALAQIPAELWTLRNLMRLYLGMSLLMLGDREGGLQAMYGAFEEERVQSEHYKATLLTSVNYIYWVAADLQSMQQTATQSLALCTELNFPQYLGHSQYNLGCVHYQRNDLAAAAELFHAVVARPYQNFGGCYARSVCGLSLIYQAQGQEAEARQVIDEAIGFLLKAGNMTQLPLIQALQAEIAFRQGNLPIAGQWADKFSPDFPLVPMYQLIEPPLILAKVWLTQNTLESAEKADVLLTRLHDYLTETHNPRFLMETLALQALSASARGDQAIALNLLESALRLARPGGFIRVFVDMGSQMAALLAQIEVDNSLQDYVLQIRSAFPAQQQPTGTRITNQPSTIHNLAEPLTNRELQILKLLREHLTNKEIAAQLVISPGTVKGHTIHIYQKLDVKGRRQAVEKAIDMGILASR